MPNFSPTVLALLRVHFSKGKTMPNFFPHPPSPFECALFGGENYAQFFPHPPSTFECALFGLVSPWSAERGTIVDLCGGRGSATGKTVDLFSGRCVVPLQRKPWFFLAAAVPLRPRLRVGKPLRAQRIGAKLRRNLCLRF